jgi:hypothetical protein
LDEPVARLRGEVDTLFDRFFADFRGGATSLLRTHFSSAGRTFFLGFDGP